MPFSNLLKQTRQIFKINQMELTDTSATFKVSNKAPEKHSNYKSEFHLKQIERLRHYRKNKCTEILQKSNFPKQTYFSDNGFVNTLTDCYNNHYNLVMRPDDVWAAIMTQFSFYINKHAEEFRGQFVNFEGKKELAVTVPGSLRDAHYDTFVKLITKEIDKNLIDPEVKKWILPSFSTTTDNDLVSVGVIFMASMKKYFDYKCCLACGIPFVTLEGTVQDWENLYKRLDKLNEYKLEKWYAMLEPIFKQFVNSRKGKVDRDFWQRICHHEAGGSGPTYISGWVTAFCVFDAEGNWIKSNAYHFGKKTEIEPWLRINIDDIPTGIVEVDVKIDDNGTGYNSIMFAGHMGAEIKKDGCTVQPVLGWTISLKSSHPDASENDKNDGEFEFDSDFD